jgi:hypothetical protein
MPGFIYYLPAPGAMIDRAAIEAAGIGYAFDDRVAKTQTVSGPDGQKGVLLRAGNPKGEPRPNAETWRKVPGGPGWVCLSADGRPGPGDLARAEIVPGHLVVLGDGNPWEIPIARGFADDEPEPYGYMALPGVATVDEEGNWTRGGVAAKYRDLWELAERWWDTIRQARVETDDAEEGASIRFDFAGTNDAALLALQTNYRIGRVEVAELGLFTDQTVQEILGAVIDWPVIERWLKKKVDQETADGSPTEGGQPADGEVTGPA